MAKTIVGLFDDFNEAQRVVQDLEGAGFNRSDISVVANQTAAIPSGSTASGATDAAGTASAAGTGAATGGLVGGAIGLLTGLGLLVIPGIGPVLAAGTLAATLGSTAVGAGIGAAAGGLIGGLTHAGVPEDEAGYYAEGVRRGGTLVTVNSPDERTDEAVAILNRHNAVDVENRGAAYKQSGYAGYSPQAQPFSAEQIAQERTRYSAPAATGTPSATNMNAANEAVIPIVEEQLEVGKRQVQRGGARIHTTVTERPVQEQVTLREERVSVERRDVDRPVADADMAFKEQTFEVTETAEQAVVAKTAHVVGEVVIGKEATERTETVRDTVRRTDVDVDETAEAADLNTSAGTTTTSTTRSNV